MGNDKKIISFGEIVWDIFPDRKVLGGAPLNFAYYCTKLGANSKIIGAVGDDQDGIFAIDILAECGVDCSFVKILKNISTGRVLVKQDTNGKHEFEIVSPAAWDFIDSRRTVATALAGADAFSYGTLASRSNISAQTCREYLNFLPPQCLKVFDINLRQNFYSKNLIDDYLKQANVVKFNDDELRILRSLFFTKSTANDEEICRAIFENYNLKYLLFTRGQNGFLILDSVSKIEKHTVKKIDFVDSVGAGDSFTAAFTSAILNGASTAEAADEAENLAAIVCSKRGALCL